MPCFASGMSSGGKGMQSMELQFAKDGIVTKRKGESVGDAGGVE